MSQDAKIVQMRETDGDSLVHLPAPLIRLRDLSAGALRRLLGEFFDNADDALFNMADKAGSNQEQVAYFDAMRELRLRRKHLTLSMQQWVARAFNEIGRFSPRPKTAGNDDFDRDALTLVDDQTLEEQVALDNMVTKARTRYGELLKLLEYRVSHLMSTASLPQGQMPLSPEVFCFGLGEACAELTIDIRAKLIVYKLFDKLMVARLEQFYREANEFLIRENVLPDMKRVPTGSARPPATGARASQGPAGGGEPGDSGNTFSELTALLHGGGTDNPVSGGGSGGSVMATPELISLLSRAQPEFAAGGDTPAELPRLQACVGQLVTGSQSGEVGQVDSDVINLVSMLFEFILEDRQLPPQMKALLARLQIPVLKVALLDRGFFNRGGHPARKLLNELAMAAIGWNEKSEGQRDPLLSKVESIVDRLLNEFTDNVALFGELLEDFQHFMNLERRRRELVEQRLRDAEEGRAKQELARTQVASAIDERIGNRDLPESTRKLLSEPWAKFLQWTCLRKGTDSDEWRSALTLTSQLIWTLDPSPANDDTRQQLLRMIPGVVDGIRAGLRTISWDPFATDAIIRDLELAHVDTLQTLVTARRAQDDTTAAPQPEPVAVDPPPVAEVPEPAAETVAEPLPEPPSGESAASAAIEPEATSAVTESPGADADDPDARWAEMAQGLRVGSWLELVEGENRLRCKLAAVIKATGKYIFVNRSGAKVAEYSLDTVASALKTGRISMLDDGLIFDRALESIIDNLRASRKD